MTRSRSFQGQNIDYSLLDLSFFSPVSLDCAAISWHKCLPYQSLTHLLTSELVTRLQVFLQWGLISFKTDHWTEKSKSTSATWGRLHLDLTYYQPSAACVETLPGHKSLRNQTPLVFLVLVSLQQAGNRRKILVGYSQKTAAIISLLNRAILTHTNPSGSPTLAGNVLRGSASKPAAAEVTCCPLSWPSTVCEYHQAALLGPEPPLLVKGSPDPCQCWRRLPAPARAPSRR